MISEGGKNPAAGSLTKIKIFDGLWIFISTNFEAVNCY
jgi:hypothetical protein